eukprot:9326746-Pyramimonas_sp.AAC.1
MNNLDKNLDKNLDHLNNNLDKLNNLARASCVPSPHSTDEEEFTRLEQKFTRTERKFTRPEAFPSALCDGETRVGSE